MCGYFFDYFLKWFIPFLCAGLFSAIFIPLRNKLKKGQEVTLFKKKWGNRKRWFMKNTNVYFTQGLMKSETEKGFEIIKRGENVMKKYFEEDDNYEIN